MNMRVNPSGINSEAMNVGQFSARFSKTQNGGGAAGSEKSSLLQYGGADGKTSQKTSTASLGSDYKTLIDSLVKQGQQELKSLKEQLAQQQSSASSQASGNGTSASGTSGSSTQNVMSQLQMLLDSISKLLKQSQEGQQTSGSSSTDSQLSSALSQLKELLSSAGVTAASGTTAAGTTTGADGTTATDGGTSAQPMPTSEKDTSVPPSSSTLFKNMDGDNRSADQIINDNPVLKNLGNQKDIKQDELKKQFGDWTSNNPDEKSRALAAKNMSYFLNNVKALDNREGGDRGKISTNGKIEGLTKDGDARHGTEAAIVKDVAEQGLDKAFPKDGRLTTTKDEMVNLNGTNKSGFQGICLKLGKALAFIPGLSNVLTGMGRAESTNPWDVIKGGIVGGVKTAFDALKGVAQGLLTGKVSPVQMLMSAYKGAVMDTYAMQDVKSDAKDKVKDIV
ncbi:hypothetical protein ACMGGR_03705 [Erwinia sp. BNK-24-b]|uniref:hypothetical protein n=1 Tax=Erwinia TaxID=551 RepID=UPI001FEE85E7|nr:hypothetical protein [Erwinia phyllosphaerae]MBV4368878.1 hypothetical protein [Erwinia phyllosphaerae]